MKSRQPDRRRFLGGAAGAVAAGLLAPGAAVLAQTPAASLAERFPDLRRHFIFEYYPWYGGAPAYEHWEYQSRNPPYDIGAPHMPLLGAYDVRSTAVLEQHARWINESGVGAIALSWWGRESFEHRAAHLVMDVMRDHDVKVTFALEPYADDRGQRFRDDVRLLIREFGERRGYDAFLILRNANGQEGPIFKGFRCVLPEFSTSCEGKTSPVSDYTPDHVWREQIDGLRDDLRRDFNHVTLLADSLEFARTPASGFDGIGIYDNFIGPELYAGIAAGASRAGLVFSLNVNPGYDQIEPRLRPADPCYSPRAFAPGSGQFDWAQRSERERASALSMQRIEMSFRQAVAVQQDPLLSSYDRGFCAIYINSFNEWHEGHTFEPMRDAKDLLPEERPFGYHNPEDGKARLAMLTRMMGSVLPPRATPGPTGRA